MAAFGEEMQCDCRLEKCKYCNPEPPIIKSSRERITCIECGGDPVVADIAVRMGHRPDVAFTRVRKLEDMLFKLGAMNEAPCFCCGYSGSGYFDPIEHKCAKRHHELYEG